MENVLIHSKILDLGEEGNLGHEDHTLGFLRLSEHVESRYHVHNLCIHADRDLLLEVLTQ